MFNRIAGNWILKALQLLLCTSFLIPYFAQGEEKTPRQLENITVIEKLGSKIDLNMDFTDQEGRTVHLGDYVKDGQPIILSLNYYQCKNLCSLQLNGLMAGLKGLDWEKQFKVITVSFDPRNSPRMALEKREMYLDALAKPGLEWNFLVGNQENVKALADSVGFQYRYDAETDQFAHTAAIYFITSGGVISRYLYGIEYSARDVKFALMDASAGRLGTTVEKLILRCFHYDELLGKYAPFAINTMRVGGVVTVLLLAIFLIILWRRDKPNRRGEYTT